MPFSIRDRRRKQGIPKRRQRRAPHASNPKLNYAASDFTRSTYVAASAAAWAEESDSA
jgi:hypothetical protein